MGENTRIYCLYYIGRKHPRLLEFCYCDDIRQDSIHGEQGTPNGATARKEVLSWLA